jgi:hypothetical protein
MDTKDLPAGTELDIMIARDIMGYKILPGDNRRDFMRGTWFDDGVRQGPIPHYSTEIVHAWEVVEKIGLFKNCVHLREDAVGVKEGDRWTKTGYRWVVERGLEPLDKNEILSYGETPALAICRAALNEAVMEYGEKS